MPQQQPPTLVYRPFWLVWCRQGGSPRVEHPTEGQALAEAERLAKVHPGHTFVVLQATHARQATDMVRVTLLAESDVPF